MQISVQVFILCTLIFSFVKFSSTLLDTYGVKEKFLYCIKARFDVKFTYTENGSTWTAEIPSELKTELYSMCDYMLLIEWHPVPNITERQNNMSIVIPQSSSLDPYTISTVKYFFDRNEYNFPGINTSVAEQISGTFRINSKDIYKNHSFECISSSNYTSDNLINGEMHMEMKSFQFETFTRTVNFEFTSDVVSCDADLTTTTTTTPPPDIQFYGLATSGSTGNNNSSGEEEPKFCIATKFGAKIDVLYETKFNKFKNVTIFVPTNGQVGGICGDNIQIIWPYNITDIVNNTSTREDEYEESSITIKFVKPTAQKLSWTFDYIIVNLTTKYFPFIQGNLTHVIWKVNSATLNQSLIPIDRKLTCEQLTLTDNENLTVSFNSFSMAAFSNDAEKVFILVSCESSGPENSFLVGVLLSILTTATASTIVATASKIYKKCKNKHKYNVDKKFFENLFRKIIKRYKLEYLIKPESNQNNQSNDNKNTANSTSSSNNSISQASADDRTDEEIEEDDDADSSSNSESINNDNQAVESNTKSNISSSSSSLAVAFRVTQAVAQFEIRAAYNQRDVEYEETESENEFNELEEITETRSQSGETTSDAVFTSEKTSDKKETNC